MPPDLMNDAPRRKRGTWPMRLAVRAVITNLVAIVAAFVVTSKALPKLEQEREATTTGPASLAWLTESPWLIVGLPVLGFGMGVAALLLRPLRGLLALGATVAMVLAVAAILGALMAALAPMYQVPKELMGAL